MTASALAWKFAISYSLTGALVPHVVVSAPPSNPAEHQTPPADVTLRSHSLSLSL